MFRYLVNKLVATADGAIIAHSRSIFAPTEAQRTQPRLLPVSLVWSVSQRTSRDINVQATIECIPHNFTSTLEVRIPYCTTELDEQ